MVLTRRTARFAELADDIDRRCRAAGVQVDADAIDDVLRYHVGTVAQWLGITERAALRYDLAEPVTEMIVTAINTPPLDDDTGGDTGAPESPARSFDRSAAVYVSAPAGGAVCCRCDAPIPAGAAAVSVPAGPRFGPSRLHRLTARTRFRPGPTHLGS